MWALVGNPEDRFSHYEAQIKEARGILAAVRKIADSNSTRAMTGKILPSSEWVPILTEEG